MKNIVARGTLYLMIAQLTITLSGYLIHIGLARYFGPEVYGQFGIILSLILITKTIFLTGTNRAVSKFISEDQENAAAIMKAGYKLQLLLISIVLLIYLVFSERIAGLFHQPELKNTILISSLVVLPLGIYIIATKGYLNGIRSFRLQAFLEAGHSILKVFFALILVWLGLGLTGAVMAYVLAPLITFFMAMKLIKINKNQGNFKIKKLFMFALPTTLFYATITLTTDLGLLMVQNILNDIRLTGFYTSAATIAKLSFTIFTALPMTMLPSISSATAANNQNLVKKYINQSFRYSLLVLLPIGAIISSLSQEILELLYSSNYISAAPTLSILVFGFIGFSLFMTISSFMSGAGKPQHAFWFSAVLLILAVILYKLLIQNYGLNGAAMTILITGLAGVAAGIIYVKRKFDTNLLKSKWKIFFASAIVYLAAKSLNFKHLSLIWTSLNFETLSLIGKSFLIISIIGLLNVIYLLILYLLKGIETEDIKLIKSVFGKS